MPLKKILSYDPRGIRNDFVHPFTMSHGFYSFVFGEDCFTFARMSGCIVANCQIIYIVHVIMVHVIIFRA